MEITWQVDDGYCGGGRPQYLEVDDNDLADCDTEQEREALISEAIQEDFEVNITWVETGRGEVQ